MVRFAQELAQRSRDQGQQLRVTVTGGEPTMHSHFDQITAALGPDSYLECITNAARSLSWWQALTRIPSRLVISLHAQYWSPSDRDRIQMITDWFCAQGCQVQYNLVADTGRWSQVQQIVQDLEPQYRSKIVVKVLQDLGDLKHMRRAELSPEQAQWIQQFRNSIDAGWAQQPQVVWSTGVRSALNPAALIAQDLHRFSGWSCSAGRQAISVDWLGRINAGICHSQYLGTIDQWAPLEENIICAKQECTCPGDIVLDKFRL